MHHFISFAENVERRHGKKTCAKNSRICNFLVYLWPVHFCLLSPWRRWVKENVHNKACENFWVWSTADFQFVLYLYAAVFIIHCTLLLSFCLNFVEFIASCVGLDLKDITSAKVVKELNHPVRLFAYWFLCRSGDLKAQYFVGDGCIIDNHLSIAYGVLALLIAYATSMLLAVLQTFVMAEPYQKETCQKDKCVSRLEETAVFQQHFAFNN